MSYIDGLMSFLNGLIINYGAFGFFVAMILQAVVAPIPGEAVMMAGGAVFGTLAAGVMGAVAGCIGASICFFISRKGGRPFVLRIVGRKELEFIDRWFERYGLWAVFIARLIPLIPVDAVSYGAGFTTIKYGSFMTATFLGMLPRAFLYAYLGELAARQIETMGMARAYLNAASLLILILIVLSAGIYLYRKIRDEGG